jgi:hypothetical protein
MDKYDELAEEVCDLGDPFDFAHPTQEFLDEIASLIRAACKPDGEFWGIELNDSQHKTIESHYAGPCQYETEGDVMKQLKCFKGSPEYDTARPVKITWKKEDADE